MSVLKYTFKVLTISGCWRPDSWSSLYKRIAYYIYTSVIILLVITFMLSQLIDVILTIGNIDDVFDNIFIVISLINVSCKLFILLINRKNILILIDILMEKACRPSESTEIKIQYKFEKYMESNSKCCVYMGMVTILCIALSSLPINFRNRKLMYRAWLPFDYTSTVPFCLTYTYQLISLAVSTLITLGCNSLICGLFVHICCQIEILTYRLRKIISCSDRFHNCVLQHYNIFRLAFIVKTKLSLIIAIQFIMTTMIMCFSLYQLDKTTTKAEYFEMILCILFVLTEIFLYCWFGNEVKIK
ncbi:odorant receptor 94a isoform X3 [Solenopsis invicta]|nr:odorant receptor 94a isoform X3 [Solenopsis invicta]